MQKHFYHPVVAFSMILVDSHFFASKWWSFKQKKANLDLNNQKTRQGEKMGPVKMFLLVDESRDPVITPAECM